MARQSFVNYISLTFFLVEIHLLNKQKSIKMNVAEIPEKNSELQMCMAMISKRKVYLLKGLFKKIHDCFRLLKKSDWFCNFTASDSNK